ncbi:glycosyltransferase family 2 protein [Clostridium sp. Mt-5]|uniref:Glycosyltransferase family 2 protein n=1 Tax=Clostridium moutaii TaxID=3240932 RepID=A0ABV4BSL8_9CLOT
MDENRRILIGSPIRQPCDILVNFISFLKNMIKKDISINYFFIDDNDDANSSNLLKNFSLESKDKVIIEEGDKIGNYIRTENMHYWKESLIWKIAEYKNRIIDYAKKNHYDYLFLIDSDIMLHPKTLLSLINSNKDIISEIFWTRWQKDSGELPQVWMCDEYSFVTKGRNEVLTQDEFNKKYTDFIEKLKKPGIYEVGGLGACTLISKEAIDKGVNFSKIYNLSFWGEDRHFCIRAAALGLKLYVDTTYPAYHIYRKDNLKEVEKFKNKCMDDINNSLYIDNFVRDFLKNFYSSDYNNINKFEANKYLCSAYADKFNKDKNNIVKYVLGKKLIYNINILDINTDKLNINGNKINIICKFQLENKSVTENSTKIFICNLELNKQSMLVENIKLINNDNKPLFGYNILDLLEERIRINKDKKNKITLAMLMRNESGKFLERVLTHAAKYVDNVVILDDASEDNSVEICKKVFENMPLTLVQNEKHGFNNEVILRKQLWEITVNTNPDWILFLDADEIFEDRICKIIRELINQPDFDYYAFRLYDMWNESHYREDFYWRSHKYYRPFLIRYQPNFNYNWQEKPLHCGRIPENIFSLPGCICYIKLKHLGWSTKELRQSKYIRYLKADPQGKYGILEQYKSILDKNPRLIKWE